MASFFTKDFNGYIPQHLQFIRNAPQAPLATSVSDFYPQTGLTSLRVDHLVSRDWAHSTDLEISHIIWANRQYRNTDNPTNAVGGYFNPRFSGFPQIVLNVDQGGDIRQSRFNYSTMVNARAATMIQNMYSLGYTEAQIEADPYVSPSPFRFSAGNIIPLTTINADPTTYFTDDSGGAANPTEFWSCTDIAWLPNEKIVNVDSAHRWLDNDYEVQDGTSEAETLAFVTHMTALCHAKDVQYMFWPNTLGNAGAIYSGVTENNAYEISEIADRLSIIIFASSTKNVEECCIQAYNTLTRNGTVKFNPDKICLTFSIGDPIYLVDTTVEEAKIAKRWAVNNGINMFRIWRNWATPGDSDPAEKVNQQLAAIAFGTNVPKPNTNNIAF